MATIKSYTDIEQSKKLAEILPKESADMSGFRNQDGTFNYYGFPYSDAVKDSTSFPVWSLAALLSVLPESYQLTSNKEGKVQLMLMHQLEKDYYDNPVDACVAMIEKLHELNLL